jgi:uroporphyrinogen-III synthase
MSFDGLRVLSLESRRAKEMEALILRHGGVPVVAPSVKEQPVEDPSEALHLIDLLERDALDMLICMTGAGMTYFSRLLAPRMSSERIAAALRRATIVSRGPKPAAVLHSIGVPVEIMIPEPNTWREIVTAVSHRTERRIGIQEYGRPSVALNQALKQMGAQVTSIAVYRWELPDDVGPLQDAARALAKREIDVVLFTSSIQLENLLDIGRSLRLDDDVKRALAEHVAVASVGPVMTATIQEYGLSADITPKYPKMVALVKAAEDQYRLVLTQKRG